MAGGWRGRGEAFHSNMLPTPLSSLYLHHKNGGLNGGVMLVSKRDQREAMEKL